MALFTYAAPIAHEKHGDRLMALFTCEAVMATRNMEII